MCSDVTPTVDLFDGKDTEVAGHAIFIIQHNCTPIHPCGIGTGEGNSRVGMIGHNYFNRGSGCKSEEKVVGHKIGLANYVSNCATLGAGSISVNYSEMVLLSSDFRNHIKLSKTLAHLSSILN
jgi:hypothetical protein